MRHTAKIPEEVGKPLRTYRHRHAHADVGTHANMGASSWLLGIMESKIHILHKDVDRGAGLCVHVCERTCLSVCLSVYLSVCVAYTRNPHREFVVRK
jgi:hypothetical protein